MPVEVTKYTCEHKCGHKALSKKESMIFHESQCWNNKKNKTCKTCDNEIYEFDGDGEQRWAMRRGCTIDRLNEMFDNIADHLQIENGIGIRPIYKCRYWNEESDDTIDNYAEYIEKQITTGNKTENFPYKPKVDNVTFKFFD